MVLTPMTELEAVNDILGAIGEAPINSLEDLNNVDAINALRILRGENRKAQARGWSFNQFNNYILNPDYFSKKILWSDNLLDIKDASGARLIKRDGYVYNMDTQSDSFDAPLVVNVILFSQFEDTPETFRMYVSACAAKRFQQQYLGDTTLDQLLARDEAEAWVNLHSYEISNLGCNMLRNPGILQKLGR